MRILTDTCTFLGLAIDSPRLSERARELYRDPDHEVFLSSVSAWEISLKHGLGRLPLPEPPERYLARLREMHGIEALPLRERPALAHHRLPLLHRDPFDRMLVAQAIDEGMVILTPDPDIARYPVRVEW